MILAQSCADLSLHFSMSQLNLYQIKIVLNSFQTRWSWLKPLSIWAQTFVYLGLNLSWSQLELILSHICFHLGKNLCYFGSNLCRSHLKLVLISTKTCADLHLNLFNPSPKLCQSWLKLVFISAQNCVHLDSNLCQSQLKLVLILTQTCVDLDSNLCWSQLKLVLISAQNWCYSFLLHHHVPRFC